MRIISGLYKGRDIEGFDIVGTRPTMNRVKESLFAMIQAYLSNAIVLDLFAGSGNLGIEALSQGARHAYLVDHNKEAVKVIKNNISKLKITDATIICDDYLKALMFFKQQQIKFDVIFLDPPYQDNLLNEAIAFIEKNNLLIEGGILICESDSVHNVLCSYSVFKKRIYSDKKIVIYKK